MTELLKDGNSWLELKDNGTYIRHPLMVAHLFGVPHIKNTNTRDVVAMDKAIINIRKADGLVMSRQDGMPESELIREHLMLPQVIDPAADNEPVVVDKPTVPADLGTQGGRAYKFDKTDKTFAGLARATIAAPTITGVTPVYADQATPGGDGALAYVAASATLTWAPFGGAAGAPVDVSAGGEFVLQAGSVGQALTVVVDAAALPGNDQSDVVLIE